MGKNHGSRKHCIFILLFASFICLSFLGFNKTADAEDSELYLRAVFERNDTELKSSIPVTIEVSSSSDIVDMRYDYKQIAKSIYFSKYAENGVAVKKNASGKYTFSATKNGYVSVYARNKEGKEALIRFVMKNIDNVPPKLEITERKAGILYWVQVAATDDSSEHVSISYVEGAYPSKDDPAWKNSKEVTDLANLLLKPVKYTFMAQDSAGNTHVIIKRFSEKKETEEEFRGIWISYLDFRDTGYTEKEFRQHVQSMFNESSAMNMNAVVVHVRPFSDAMYPSEYFPWSEYASGEQGKAPGYDPLAIMIEEAHARNLEFHAWLNPYRVTSNNTNIYSLSDQNPARKWRTDATTANDRNVLTYDGQLYYNPASKAVQTLIVNGIREIVENYDVDGIHFDDYFYPALGKNYKTNFDAKEYDSYAASMKKAGKTPLTIDNWRRDNVNTLVKAVYAAVKKVNKNVVFGISPGGFLDSLRANDKYYVDVDRWLGYDGYIDYLCPQLYWSNDQPTYPFDGILARFAAITINPDVKLYIGIGAYKAGIKTEGPDWYQNPYVLSDMIKVSRSTDEVEGFIIYGYRYMIQKRNYTSIKNLVKELQ